MGAVRAKLFLAEYFLSIFEVMILSILFYDYIINNFNDRIYRNKEKLLYFKK
jgi:hypothetical protein